MYVYHDISIRPLTDPVFKDNMSVEPAPKVYLQNKLLRCREKLQELQSLLTVKRMFLLRSPHLTFLFRAFLIIRI